jgi:ribosomal protein S18 acetylase RimI-like enzyme
MSPIVRPALPADATRVAEVLLSSRRAFLPYAAIAHPDDDVHEWVKNVLIPSGSVTVAQVDGNVAGALATAEEDDASWITQLYLAPAHVRLGIGTLLLRHALSLLQPPVRLYTFQQNTGARRFFERFGFKAMRFTDGSENEERCPDVLYELYIYHGGDRIKHQIA